MGAEDWILDVIPEVDKDCVGALDFDGFSALVRGCEDPAEVSITADQVVTGPTEKTLQTNVTNLPLETVVSELSAVVDQLQSVACHATSNPGSESNLSSPLSAQTTMTEDTESQTANPGTRKRRWSKWRKEASACEHQRWQLSGWTEFDDHI